MKGNSANKCEFFKVHNFFRGGYCDCSPRASKKTSYVTVCITVMGCLDVVVGRDSLP